MTPNITTESPTHAFRK